MSAHASSRNPEHTVFVGNIPYGVTEEMLTEIFSEVGPVKYFRLVTDRETGRQKGFGFCEYYDKDTAQSAIRNLAGHEVNGRHLRVDCTDASNEKGDRKATEKPQSKPQAHIVTATEAAHAAQGMAAAVGSTNLGPGQDQITDALSKMPRAALYDIMAQMKGLIQQNQQQARQILVTNPSLTRALFQAQILLGMLKNPLSSDATPPQALPQGPPQQQPVPVPGPAPQQQPQQQQQHYQPPQVPQQQQQQQQHAAMRPQQVPPNANVQYPPQDMQGPPQQGLPGAPQPLRNPHGQPMGAMPGRGQGAPGPRPAATVQSGAPGQQYGPPMQQAPPAGQAGHPMPGPGPGPGQAARRPHDPRMRGSDPRQQAQPRPAQQIPQQQPQPQPQPQAQPQQNAAANLPAEQQKVLLQQIMQLSPAQIEGLPPEQKAQVLALQQQMRAQPSMLQ